MLKDRAYNYFIEQDKNCAETVLLAISDEYGLGLTEADMKLVSGFGAGIGCGNICGALAGCVGALGKMTVQDRAHATEGFGDLCADLVKSFETKLGHTQCEVLKPMYRNDEVRCLKAVELALEMFEEFAGKHGLAG